MGVVKNIRWDTFPVQNIHTPDNIGIGTLVEVVFEYDTAHMVKGVIVRDDNDEPHRTIIALEDGRIILGTECRFMAPIKDGHYVDANYKFGLWEHLDATGITATFNK